MHMYMYKIVLGDFRSPQPIGGDRSTSESSRVDGSRHKQGKPSTPVTRVGSSVTLPVGCTVHYVHMYMYLYSYMYVY